MTWAATRISAGLAAAVLTLACTDAGRGPVFATSEHFAEAPRKPPSFSAEPASPLSATLETAKGAATTDRLGLQVARVPLDSEVARELVSRFFIAVLAESTRELFPLLAAQATVLSEGNRQPAQAVWRARFAQLDYASLTGRVVAAPQTLRTYTWSSAERAKHDGVPPPLSPTEVVVLARVTQSWTGKTRLFGDALAFRLRPKGDEPAFEIAEIVEDFRLP